MILMIKAFTNCLFPEKQMQLPHTLVSSKKNLKSYSLTYVFISQLIQIFGLRFFLAQSIKLTYFLFDFS